MKHSANVNAIPFYRQKIRNKTPSSVAIEYASKGWTWNGKKYHGRESWTAAVKESYAKMVSTSNR